MNHSQRKTHRTRRLLGEQVEESPSYVDAGYAFALGQAVHDRRRALGLSQGELARRASMPQPQISNIEGGDSVPALPLLTRLAKALDASLTIGLDGILARLATHGVDHEPVETYGNGVRRVVVLDPDGNSLSLAEAPTQ